MAYCFIGLGMCAPSHIQRMGRLSRRNIYWNDGRDFSYSDNVCNLPNSSAVIKTLESPEILGIKNREGNFS